MSFGFKSNLKAHLQRKNICNYVGEDEDIDVKLLIDELYESNLNETAYDCKWCNRYYNR